MAQTQHAIPAPEEEPAGLAEWRERVRGANINQTSLLATDYLNHFNEVVMLIEMVPDMPDCLDDVRDWRPMSYKDHFAHSGFSDKDLAIAAYDHAPAHFRERLETTIDQLDRLVALSIKRIDAALAEGDADLVSIVVARATRDLHRMVEVASATINGAVPTIGQDDIDSMFAD